MAEVSFAKTFVSTLDTRPLQLSADHVEDARKFPARPPHILPRMSKPMSKPNRSAAVAAGQERTVKVTLKSLRNPPLDIKLSDLPLTTSIIDIKAQVTSQTRIPVNKIKFLHNKKPVADTKVLKDVLGEGEHTSVEFSIMIIGGAAAIPPLPTEEDATAAASPAAAAVGAAALETDEFWSDLKGFLTQRLKDEQEAAKLSTLFKSSWQSS
ncbi:Ubiquitin family [Geosmithia morbida]|uniref:Ubiquitin family n=1 Tax=Geosmithia morbida TaxID=1094350 RepID=A0A9P4Z4D9_9HYPO|nr:Ubiquitin family [Geosmithia morbida]KAF4126434.1 Ubiquitin family [Geosmithia morbida]